MLLLFYAAAVYLILFNFPHSVVNLQFIFFIFINCFIYLVLLSFGCMLYATYILAIQCCCKKIIKLNKKAKAKNVKYNKKGKKKKSHNIYGETTTTEHTKHTEHIKINFTCL